MHVVSHKTDLKFLKRIKKYDLPLYILNKPKQQIKPLLDGGIGCVALEKIFDDLNGTEISPISLLAVGGQ